jgi:hypothetical protein
MKKHSLLPAVSCMIMLVACHAGAQDAVQVEAAPVPAYHSGGFMTVVLSGGILDILNWAGIFLWAFLGLPLGILSIVHCATLRVRQYPIATKLLIIGVVWLFVLGWVGVAQGTISAFSMLACGAPDVGVLALNISQAVYSIAGALAVCQHYLFFLLISMAIIHFKHKRMLENS